MASYTTRVSTTSSGAQADGASYLDQQSYQGYGAGRASAQVFNPDGSEIVFTTSAENLADGAPSGVILKNLQTGQETAAYVSQTSGGLSNAQFIQNGNAIVFENQVKVTSGNTTAFEQEISEKNLTTGAVNTIAPSGNATGVNIVAASNSGNRVAYSAYSYSTYQRQDYVKDFDTGESLKVGPATGRGQFTPIQFNPGLTKAMYSASLASDNGFTQVHVEDLTTGTTSVASATANNVEGNASSSGAFLSQDGTEAVFSTPSTNLSSAAPQGGVFVKNLATGALGVVAANSGSGNTYVTDSSRGLSADGNQVAIINDTYTSGARNAADTSQLQIADLSTGTTKTISPSLTLTEAKSGGSTTSTDGMEFGQTAFSADGTKIAYVENTVHYSAGSGSQSSQLFVYDATTNTTTAVSQPTSQAQGFNSIENIAFSPDGSQIAYSVSSSSNATVVNLTSGQSVTVPASSVFFSPDSKSFAYSSTDPNQVPDDTNDESDVFTSAVCFASKTLIRTARGDVPVECLRVGDLAATASGALRPIRWIGHRTVDCGRHPEPRAVRPVCITAHAFGPARPERDLLVSPGHAICVDLLGEVLIPAAALVDGSRIVQIEVETVTYWHVELDTHDILLAENLPAESYLEMGNRGFFAESDTVVLSAGPDAAVRTHAAFCRPFHATGAVVEAVRRLLARTPAHAARSMRVA